MLNNCIDYLFLISAKIEFSLSFEICTIPQEDMPEMWVNIRESADLTNCIDT